MNLDSITLMLAQGGGEAAKQPPMWTSLMPLVLMVVVFYFVILRPQQKKSKEHANLLKTVRTNDKVVTGSGIIGTVVGIKEKTVTIRSSDTKLEILKSAISDITERGGESSEA